ncbi:MAG: glutamine--fructose-6-phosphate aminotransferase [Deltaproteobacteria bacterium RBG_13_61_14]|nr:MAG: glutamine--fructose-6-phosphate aminotransferase [Deltaproteobacteria bacterium RBG_13_61_14]
MCGIIGYIGKREAPEILMEGLKRLEYRGYDSAGLALLHQGRLEIRRCQGKLAVLEALLKESPVRGQAGIGHTRWATHGRPSEENAHPHRVGAIAVVHNGIVENFAELKAELIAAGEKFSSETDTEVISHLVHQYVSQGLDFEAAARKALLRLQGAYAVLILNEKEPDRIIAAKQASPMILGLGEGENLVASDIPALISHTQRVVPLEDGDYAVIRADRVEVKNLQGEPVVRKPRAVQWTPAMAEKGGYKHYMQKEIFEQPRAVAETLAGRIKLEAGEVSFEDFAISEGQLRQVRRIAVVACGTAWHAGLVGKYLLEQFCGLPVEVDIASEFRYRKPLLDSETLLILISQSGETADTLAALEEGRRRGARILSICNVMEASIPRRSDGVIYTRAGPEIGVASTKAFVTQLAVLYLFAVHLAGVRGALPAEARREMLKEILRVPHLIKDVLKTDEQIQAVARQFYRTKGFFFIGRGIHFPLALEGALKLKEISYIHAEGYPAGELKHGPIALVDENMPVVVLAPRNAMFEKVMSNLEEVAARGGKIIALVTAGDEGKVAAKATEVIPLPQVAPELVPILLAVPLQLLAYHVAVLNGTDVDQPRNLAKSVTVE